MFGAFPPENWGKSRSPALRLAGMMSEACPVAPPNIPRRVKLVRSILSVKIGLHNLWTEEGRAAAL